MTGLVTPTPVSPGIPAGVRPVPEAIACASPVSRASARSFEGGEAGRAERATPYDHDSEDEVGEGAAAGGGGAPVLVDTKAKVRKVLEPISGIPQYSPIEQQIISGWRDSIRRVFERYGFSRFFPDPVLSLAALILKGGLDHEMYGVYRVTNAEGAGFGLPFDRTVPFALYAARNASTMTFPFARYDIGPAARAEAAARGRYRIFEQCDVDCLNRGSPVPPEREAESIAAIVEALREMGIPDFYLCINHLAISRALIARIGVPEEKIPAVLKQIDKIEKIGKEAVIAQISEEVAGLEEGKIAEVIERLCAPVSLEDPIFEDVEGEDVSQAVVHLRSVTTHLRRLGIDPSLVQLRPNMVRGLDYYTGVVFETFIRGQESLGSIASGGAYDDLVGVFNPAAKDIHGFGGSIGTTRLFAIMKEIHAFDELRRKVTHDITVIASRAEDLDHQSEITQRLRRVGYRVAMLMASDGSLRSQLKIANSWGAPWVVIVREDGRIVLKDMNASVPTQTEYSSSDELFEKVATLGLTRV